MKYTPLSFVRVSRALAQAVRVGSTTMDSMIPLEGRGSTIIMPAAQADELEAGDPDARRPRRTLRFQYPQRVV